MDEYASVIHVRPAVVHAVKPPPTKSGQSYFPWRLVKGFDGALLQVNTYNKWFREMHEQPYQQFQVVLAGRAHREFWYQELTFAL